eukprot:TRINITY_DN7040_c0_g1_i4.p1 TRINITY_DN7040_c0_g1~~TRINITY_DN7040_c0_g1_i4.p1  ORF type:complete len:185 (-),score=9.00 TRINITY_DN7040_c0_g1_i4:306-860(-)
MGSGSRKCGVRGAGKGNGSVEALRCAVWKNGARTAKRGRIITAGENGRDNPEPCIPQPHLPALLLLRLCFFAGHVVWVCMCVMVGVCVGCGALRPPPAWLHPEGTRNRMPKQGIRVATEQRGSGQTAATARHKKEQHRSCQGWREEEETSGTPTPPLSSAGLRVDSAHTAPSLRTHAPGHALWW